MTTPRVLVEVDLEDVLEDIAVDDLLEAVNNDDEVLRELKDRLNIKDFVDALDADEILDNVDLDDATVGTILGLADRIGEVIPGPVEALDFCKTLLQGHEDDEKVKAVLAIINMV